MVRVDDAAPSEYGASQCHVLESPAAALQGTRYPRVSPLQDRADDLRILPALCTALAQRPGIVGAHHCGIRHPRCRNHRTAHCKSADRVADWVFVVLGYEAHVVQSLVDADSPAALRASGAAEGALSGLYTLALATPDDVAGLNTL